MQSRIAWLKGHAGVPGCSKISESFFSTGFETLSPEGLALASNAETKWKIWSRRSIPQAGPK
jgi:hypothetical protein